jgi:hypothetical protein
MIQSDYSIFFPRMQLSRGIPWMHSRQTPAKGHAHLALSLPPVYSPLQQIRKNVDIIIGTVSKLDSWLIILNFGAFEVAFHAGGKRWGIAE